MFSLTIVFGPGPMVWTLMYKKYDNVTVDSVAALMRSEAKDDMIEMKDDFGQRVLIKESQLHGWMIEDLEQSRLAHIERALHQARTQAKGAEIADSDPVLKQARHRAQGGMPMIQPMSAFRPNGGFPS